MHDIGKVEINETILSKPGKLNAEEWNVIRKHSEMGYQILSSDNEFAKIIEKCAGTQFDPEIVRIFVDKVLGKAAD